MMSTAGKSSTEVTPLVASSNRPTAVLGIDPGPTHSAFSAIRPGEPPSKALKGCGYLENEKLLPVIRQWSSFHGVSDAVLAIETYQNYNLRVGKDVFESIFWTGRFYEVWMNAHSDPTPPLRLTNPQIRGLLCHSSSATQSAVSEVLYGLFGPGRKNAIGTKKEPGPMSLYTPDPKNHLKDSLAVAVAAWWKLCPEDCQ